MSNTNPVRVGIIGTGVGIRTLLPGFRALRQVEVVGLVGSSHRRALEFARSAGIPRAFASYQELVDQPEIDLICVASPNRYHYEEAMYTLKTNKHLLVEKPLASSVAETRKLVQSAAKRGALAIVDHQLRFNPYMREIRRILAEGRLGRLYLIRIHQQGVKTNWPNATWNWSFDEKEGGGVLLAMGSHLIDLIWLWLGQGKVYSVNCSIDPVITQRIDNEGVIKDIRTSSFFAANIVLENQVTASLSATAAGMGEPRFDIDIFGSEGELHFDLGHKLRGSFLGDIGKVEDLPVGGVTEEERKNAVPIFKGSFVYFASKIVDAIRVGGSAHVEGACTFKEALRTQEVLDALQTAATKGFSVRMDSGYQSRALI